MKNNIFREKSIEKISSPEQINDYLKTSHPSIKAILTAIVILIAGALIWSVFGKLEIASPSVAVCENGKVYCYIQEKDVNKLTADTYAKIDNEKYQLTNISKLPSPVIETLSPYAVHVAGFENDDWVYTAEIEAPLDDGIYSADIIIQSVSPISLFIN